MKQSSDRERQAACYTTPPSADSDEIRLAIEQGTPEKILGLSWDKPDFAATGHKIVCTFSIDRRKRGHRGFIPCAICSDRHPKFLEGAVLWSPDKCLRVIGHICAANHEHFGESGYRNLQSRRKQEQLDDAALEWLQVNIGYVPAIRASINELIDVALFLEEQQSAFFRNVPLLAEFLANVAMRQGGELTIVAEASGMQKLLREATSGMSISSYNTISFGALEGSEFLRRPARKRSRELQAISEVLGSVPTGDPDDALLKVLDGGEQGVTVLAGMALRAIQRGLKFAEQCASANCFVKDSNVELMRRWGGDGRAQISMQVQRSVKSITFILTEDRSRAVLAATWPKLPDMSQLRAVAEAGISLGNLLPRSL